MDPLARFKGPNHFYAVMVTVKALDLNGKFEFAT